VVIVLGETPRREHVVRAHGRGQQRSHVGQR
jgi:hypothetical protein